MDYNPENTTTEVPALASIATSVEPDHWIRQPLIGSHVQLAPVEPPELQPEPLYLQESGSRFLTNGGICLELSSKGTYIDFVPSLT